MARLARPSRGPHDRPRSVAPDLAARADPAGDRGPAPSRHPQGLAVIAILQALAAAIALLGVWVLAAWLFVRWVTAIYELESVWAKVALMLAPFALIYGAAFALLSKGRP